VLLIVEGPSDATSLGKLFTLLFDPDKVEIYVVYGDITADHKITPANILNHIGSMVKEYISTYHIQRSDVAMVIQITDTDGVFIPDQYIIDDKAVQGIRYEQEGIHTASPDDVSLRNERKRAAINKLISTPTIMGIRYSLYYMSCNLEHVLHGEMNCDDQRKKDLALDFVLRYEDDLPGFIDLLRRYLPTAADGYTSSWNLIKGGTSSLHRFTNLGLCLPDHTTVSNADDGN